MLLETLLYALYHNLNHFLELACTPGNLLDTHDVLSTPQGIASIIEENSTQSNKYCYKTTRCLG